MHTVFLNDIGDCCTLQPQIKTTTDNESRKRSILTPKAVLSCETIEMDVIASTTLYLDKIISRPLNSQLDFDSLVDKHHDSKIRNRFNNKDIIVIIGENETDQCKVCAGTTF